MSISFDTALEGTSSIVAVLVLIMILTSPVLFTLHLMRHSSKIGQKRSEEFEKRFGSMFAEFRNNFRAFQHDLLFLYDSMICFKSQRYVLQRLVNNVQNYFFM